MISTDGGPAFPWTKFDQNHGHNEGRYEIFHQFSGVSMRDWFAAMAMQGIITGCGNSAGEVNYREPTVAENAYDMADAMLKARENAK